ncbi:MAG TPA: hypothetical protein VFR96_01410 [Povalibacter sp.]|jgi:hypothetical protein|nr:hypothetical protein [Povalibacter sp.]
MTRWTPLLAIQALLFAVASLVHAGILLSGYEHSRAAVAEGVIALVLFAGLVVSFVRPQSTRTTALVTQGFALLGTLVGAFTIAIGVGPQTTADYVFHVLLLALLVSGLVVAWKSKRAL